MHGVLTFVATVRLLRVRSAGLCNTGSYGATPRPDCGGVTDAIIDDAILLGPLYLVQFYRILGSVPVACGECHE